MKRFMALCFICFTLSAHASLDSTLYAKEGAVSQIISTRMQSISLFPFTSSFMNHVMTPKGETIRSFEASDLRWYSSAAYFGIILIICIAYLGMISFDFYLFNKKGVLRKRIVSEILYKYEKKRFWRRPHFWATAVAVTLALLLPNGSEAKISFVTWVLQLALIWLLLDRMTTYLMGKRFEKEMEKPPVEYPG